MLIDAVKEELPKYLQLIQELDLRLVFAIDTHVHADHVTALGALRESTECASIMGVQSRAECVSRKLHDGENQLPRSDDTTSGFARCSRHGCGLG